MYFLEEYIMEPADEDAKIVYYHNLDQITLIYYKLQKSYNTKDRLHIMTERHLICQTDLENNIILVPYFLA